MPTKVKPYLEEDLILGKDFFSLFALSPDEISKPSITKAFRTVTMKHHPDQHHGKSDTVLERHGKIMQKATRARKVLSNPEMREDYMKALENAATERSLALRTKGTEKADRRQKKISPGSPNTTRIDPITSEGNETVDIADFNKPYREKAPKHAKRQSFFGALWEQRKHG